MMDYLIKDFRNELEHLAEDAGYLIDGTATAAGVRYDQVCKGLSAVLERGRNLYGVARGRALKMSQPADVVLHDNLYQTILIGIGVGVLPGDLAARRDTDVPD